MNCCDAEKDSEKQAEHDNMNPESAEKKLRNDNILPDTMIPSRSFILSHIRRPSINSDH